MSAVSDLLAAGLQVLASATGADLQYRTTSVGAWVALSGFMLNKDRIDPHTMDGDHGDEVQVRIATLKGPLTPAMADGYQIKDVTTGEIYACRAPKLDSQQVVRVEMVDVEKFGPDRKGHR